MNEWRDGRKSPLRLEVNPWTSDDDLHVALQLRGAFIGAMGTIETILAEIVIRSSKVPEYSALRARFPSRRTDMTKYLRSLCTAEGPLEPWSPLLRQVLERQEAHTELRDILAHARMQILTGPGKHSSIKLEDYYPHDEHRIAFRMRNLSRKDLEGYARRITNQPRCGSALQASRRTTSDASRRVSGHN